MRPKTKITVALTGASAMPVAIELIRQLLRQQITLSIVYSKAAQQVAYEESCLKLPDCPIDAKKIFCAHFNVPDTLIYVYHESEWTAPIASGSSADDAMIICPASMGTVSAVAHGKSDNLLTRAADVILKEKKPLIIVPREAPLSVIHLKNLLKLAKMGVSIIPAMMTFYQKPQHIDSMIKMIVSRILNHLDIEPHDAYHWNPNRENNP